MSVGQFAPSGIISGINDSYDSDLPESCRIPEDALRRDAVPVAVRRCSCGTRLSRYNPSSLCNACKLREAQPEPVKLRINNNSGLRGVLRCGDKWKAQRQVKGMKRHLGVFDTAMEAHMAWKNAV